MSRNDVSPTANAELVTLDIRKEIEIEAPASLVFESLFDAVGPPDLRVEPRVGGRWYRDLGNEMGHLWGHVQVIKPPSLLELHGPMFLSHPVVSHVQFRLSEERGRTVVTLIHRAFGDIPPEDVEGLTDGWEWSLKSVRKISEGRLSQK